MQPNFYSGRTVTIILIVALIVGGAIGWLSAPLVWTPEHGYVWTQ